MPDAMRSQPKLLLALLSCHRLLFRVFPGVLSRAGQQTAFHIQSVSEPIPHQVERQDDQHDGEAGDGGEMGGQEEERPAVA